LQLNLSYFETAKTGDLSHRLTEDIDRVGEVVNKVFHQFVPCILQLMVVLGYMVYLNWQLALTFAANGSINCVGWLVNSYGCSLTAVKIAVAL